MNTINIPMTSDIVDAGLYDWYKYVNSKPTDIDVAWTLSQCGQNDLLFIIRIVHELMTADHREDFGYALEKSWKFPEYYIPAFIRAGVKLYSWGGHEATNTKWVVETDDEQDDYLVWKD